MKRLILTVVFLLGYLIFTGSSIGPDETSKYISSGDSATLEVKFQNPRVIVSDERTSDAITSYLRDRDSLLTASVKEFFRETKDVIEQDQERRYESAMDYLSRSTGLSPPEIKDGIETAVRRDNAFKLSYSLIVIALVFLWWLFTKNKLYDWQDRLVQLMGLIAFSVALYILFCAILRSTTPVEYHFMYEILNLS